MGYVVTNIWISIHNLYPPPALADWFQVSFRLSKLKSRKFLIYEILKKYQKCTLLVLKEYFWDYNVLTWVKELNKIMNKNPMNLEDSPLLPA